MNIVDDKLVFDRDSDILRFTPVVQKALAKMSGEGNPPETFAVKAFNDAVELATNSYQQTASDTLNYDSLAGALTVAEPAVAIQAQALINQAKTLLGVPLEVALPGAVGLNPVAEKPVPK